MEYLFASLIGYFFGSIPFSYVVPKLIKNVDVRTVGSCNVGTTNVYRTCGIKVALIAFFLDLFKGVFVIVLTYKLWGDSVALFAGFMTTIGHCYSPMLKFKGGKGVATSAGQILFLNPLIFAIVFSLEIALIFITKTVSIPSITVATLFPIIAILLKAPRQFIVYSFALAFFVIFKHKDNIKRIMAGEEKKLDFKKKTQ